MADTSMLNTIRILGAPTTDFETRYFIKKCIKDYNLKMKDVADTIKIEYNEFSQWINSSLSSNSKTSLFIQTLIKNLMKQFNIRKDPLMEEKTIPVSVRFSRKQMNPVIVKIPVGSRIMDLIAQIVGTGVLYNVKHQDIDSIRFRGKTIDWGSDVLTLVGDNYDSNKDVFKLVVYYSFWH